MFDFLDEIFGFSLKSEQLGFGHMAARAVLMYAVLIIIVRSAKKRFLSKATAFDFILTVMIGSIAARAMTGGAPFFPSILGVVVMVVIHWIISWKARRSAGLSHLIKGHDTLLIKDGQVFEKRLADAHMSRDDLNEDLRQKGVSGPSDVREARLERSGKLSVIKN
jgi:uncharacterized membrane protein YcaP (DUF421 family)